MVSWSMVPEHEFATGVHEAPSSSVYDRMLHEPSSPPAHVRPVAGSVARMGSRLGVVTGRAALVHVALPPEMTILYVVAEASNRKAPVARSAPMLGSPALLTPLSVMGPGEIVNVGVTMALARGARTAKDAATATAHATRRVFLLKPDTCERAGHRETYRSRPPQGISQDCSSGASFLRGAAAPAQRLAVVLADALDEEAPLRQRAEDGAVGDHERDPEPRAAVDELLQEDRDGQQDRRAHERGGDGPAAAHAVARQEAQPEEEARERGREEERLRERRRGPEVLVDEGADGALVLGEERAVHGREMQLVDGLRAQVEREAVEEREGDHDRRAQAQGAPVEHGVPLPLPLAPVDAQDDGDGEEEGDDQHREHRRRDAQREEAHDAQEAPHQEPADEVEEHDVVAEHAVVAPVGREEDDGGGDDGEHGVGEGDEVRHGGGRRGAPDEPLASAYMPPKAISRSSALMGAFSL